MGERVTKEMLERFISNLCNEAEAEAVAAQLMENPALIKQYFPEHEFLMAESDRVLADFQKKKIWKEVLRGLHKQKRTLYLRRTLAAASILIGIVTAMFFYRSQADDPLASKGTMAIAALQRQENKTQSELTVLLPDESELRLMPGAIVTYSKTFKTNRRLQLQGEALFKVAKDLDHPFVVDAAGVAVRALGTQFRIKENGMSGTVDVSLLEGKIVVYPIESRLKLKQYFLEPGEQLFIDIKSSSARLQRAQEEKLKLNKQIESRNKAHADKDRSSEKGKVVWENKSYVFSQQPLRKVFDRIEKRYQVKVVLLDEDIAQYRFSGQIMYRDSLEILLNHLCRLNGLQYIRNGQTITVRKQ